RRRKLEHSLARHGVPTDRVQLLTALAEASAGDAPEVMSLSPQRRRQKTLEALLELLQEIGRSELLCFVVEDLHWADASTLELLDLLVDQGPMMGIFVLLTARPMFRVPWAPRSHISQVVLSRLPRDSVEALIRDIAQGSPLPAEVVRELGARADGVPLFIEELTRAVLESGQVTSGDGQAPSGASSSLSIPATLRTSLMARLDHLGEPKQTVQLAAMLGREFSYELLRAVSPLDEPTLRAYLKALVEREFIYQTGVIPRARYVFK